LACKFIRHQLRPEVIDAKDRSDPRRSVRKSVPADRVQRHRKHPPPGRRMIAAFVNEMDANIIHLGFEMGELIAGRFMLAPVVGVVPIGDEFFQITEIGAWFPIYVPHLIGPPRVFSAAATSRSTPPERHD
jgi:hypothetical protein